jgi:hypothetical protein
LWDIFLAHATAIQDYTPQLLGTETSHPWAGPDFATMYRDGVGRIYVAVNLSRLSARLPPFALEDLASFASGEVIDGDERTAIVPAAALDTPIPGGGVLILSGTLTTPTNLFAEADAATIQLWAENP